MQQGLTGRLRILVDCTVLASSTNFAISSSCGRSHGTFVRVDAETRGQRRQRGVDAVEEIFFVRRAYWIRQARPSR